MNKSDFKTLIIFLVVFGVIGLGAYIISLNLDDKEKNVNTYLVIDGDRFLEYGNDGWRDIGFFSDMVMKKFKVYEGNNYVGDYSISENNGRYYFFDSNYEDYDIEDSFIAVSYSDKIKPVNYIEDSFNDEDYRIVYNYLKREKIDYNGDYSTEKKYVVDLNSDDRDDCIYIVSNQLYSDDIFYVIFARVNNKYITINKQANVDDIKVYELAWILNTKNDKLSDIILKRFYTETYDYYLYSYFRKSGYQEILSGK